jgi:hypothetical protein
MSSAANQNWASAPVSGAAGTVASVGGLTAPPGLDAGDHHVMTVIGTGLVGAGRIEESPDPCIIQWPDPFQVTADWVFVSGI